MFLHDVQAGHRLTPNEGEFLMKMTGRDVFRVTAAVEVKRSPTNIILVTNHG